VKALQAIRHCIAPEGWKSLGLAPNFGGAVSDSPRFATQAIKLTTREAAALLRWDHQIFPQARYDVALGVSLASKGLVAVVGWYADGNVRHGESMPDWIVLTPRGPMDTRDGKIHAEYHALCELTPLGRNVLRHSEGAMRAALVPNRKTEPVIEVK